MMNSVLLSELLCKYHQIILYINGYFLTRKFIKKYNLIKSFVFKKQIIMPCNILVCIFSTLALWIPIKYKSFV